ncbi:phenylacetic acid degradation protein PaaY [Pokkaliibacter sp. CJK22405]|uniref:phenylacetic acid degradation protein PaaY n=1 Tax=Pokkaliibacter sp. CJK22405 TaxID=3384615 RepID=UPI0039849F93
MPAYAFDGNIPVVSQGSYVHPSAVLIGDVIIGENCYVGPLVSLRGDLGQVKIDHDSHIQDNCVIHADEGGRVHVGSHCHIAAGSVLYNCTLGRRCFIGMGSVILDRAIIGQQSMVSPASHVQAGFNGTESQLLAGNPAYPCGAVTMATLYARQQADQRYRELVIRARHTLQEVDPLSTVAHRHHRASL